MKTRCFCRGNRRSSMTKKSSHVPGGEPSCFVRSWRFWRNFCCLYGMYPVLVAPILTAAFLLSLYSAAGCEYVHVDVGFTPSNAAYNESKALLGFFFYYQNGLSHENLYRETFHAGCDRYTDTFEQDFIEQDRTWKVSRTMASIAVCSGLISAVLAWMIVLTPVPAGCFWPTVLLPLVMLSFIAEGSKFLIFDIALCSNSMWLPSGVDSLPQTAASCTLGTSAILGIVSGSLFLVSLLMVCLYTPERRTLDPNYGIAYSAGNEMIPTKEDSENAETVEDYTLCASRGVDPYPMRDVESEFGDEDVYTSAGNSDVRTNYSVEQQASTKSDGSCNNPMTKPVEGDHPSIDSCIISKSDVVGGGTGASPDSHHHHLPPTMERISESRLSKMEELELNRSNFPPATDSLIDQLVSELNDSLACNNPLGGNQHEHIHHQSNISSQKDSDFSQQQRFL